jgi:hypothetical protein
MLKTKVVFSILISMLCLFASMANAEMSSTSYRISATVISGGGNAMSSASYHTVSTLGQPSPLGTAASASYNNSPGFWHTLLMITLGDVNGDGNVDLEDVISALQIVTGQASSSIMLQSDANGDGYIGMAEALMILRQLGGL